MEFEFESLRTVPVVCECGRRFKSMQGYSMHRRAMGDIPDHDWFMEKEIIEAIDRFVARNRLAPGL